MKKRLLSALLALCLVVGLVPATLVTAGAANPKTTITGISAIGGLSAPVAGQAAPTKDTITLTGAGGSVSVQSVSVSGATGGVWSAGQAPRVTINFTYDTTQYQLASTGFTVPTAAGWTITRSGNSLTCVSDGSGVDANGRLNWLGGQTIALENNQTVVNDLVRNKSVTIKATSIAGNQAGGTITAKSNNTDIVSASVSGNNLTLRGLKAGTGTVTLTAARANNYEAATTTITVTVVGDATVKFGANTPKTATYGDAAANITASASVGAATETANGTWTWTSSDATVVSVAGDAAGAATLTFSKAGTAVITATFVRTSDSATGSATWTVTVNPKKVPVPLADERSYKYNGGDHTYTLTDSTGNKGTVYTVKNNVQKVAGTHTVSAVLNDKINYVWASTNTADDLTYSFVIIPKTLSEGVQITSTATPVTYDSAVPKNMDDAIAARIVVTDAGNALVKDIDYTLSYPSTPTVGNHTVTVTGIGNYSGTRTDAQITVAAGTHTLSGQALAVAAGQSIDLANALSSTVSTVDVGKLSNLTFTLTNEATDKANATISGKSFRANAKAPHGTAISVTVTAGGYDANNDGVVEYTTTGSPATFTVTIYATNMVTKVNVPTGKAGLVYTAAAQELVAAPRANDLWEFVTPTSVYQSAANEVPGHAVEVKLKAAPANTYYMWADGTTANKTIYVPIAKVDPIGTISYTNVVGPNKVLSDVTLTSGFYAVDRVSLLTGTFSWLYSTPTAVVVEAGRAYNWKFVPDTPNYNEVTGSVVLWGEGGATTDDKKDETQTTVTNPDGSVSVVKRNTKTGVTTYTTTGNNGTSSVVTFTNGAITSITANNTGASGAQAYIPLPGIVTWGSVATINGAVDYTAVPASGLGGMWVNLPSGSSTIQVSSASRYFTDVAANSWYAPGVNFCSARNYIQGVDTSRNLYDSSSTLTNGHVWTMLGRYVGAFTVAQSNGLYWYQMGYNWAVQNGISSGSHTDAASREDLALMMYNTYLRYRGATSVNQNSIYSMNDYATISAGARTAVAWAVQVGIIQGYPGNTFQPHNTVNRGEAATMMARFAYVMAGRPVPTDLYNS